MYLLFLFSCVIIGIILVEDLEASEVEPSSLVEVEDPSQVEEVSMHLVEEPYQEVVASMIQEEEAFQVETLLLEEEALEVLRLEVEPYQGVVALEAWDGIREAQLALAFLVVGQVEA